MRELQSVLLMLVGCSGIVFDQVLIPKVFTTIAAYCLSSQSEVGKPLADWHAKSLTTLTSGALSLV